MSETGNEGNLFRPTLLSLTLGILGSSVLPVPWAFSRAGIVPALVVAGLVAFANAYTGANGTIQEGEVG